MGYMKAKVNTAPIEPDTKFNEGLLSLARLFFLAHIWIDSFVKKLKVSLGITRKILARLPFQKALLPSSLEIRLAQSKTPIYEVWILLRRINYGMVCRRVLIISRGKVTVFMAAMPMNAIICLPINFALLYYMCISIAYSLAYIIFYLDFIITLTWAILYQLIMIAKLSWARNSLQSPK